MSDFILLMGHGSRCCLGATEFLDLVDGVRAAAPDLPIETGFLEFGGPMVPTIQEGVDRCVARGATRIFAVPILLFYAGHGKRDMPGQIELARQRYPQVELVLCEALGIHRSLLEITEDRIASRLATLPPVAPEDTAILLVARGTTDGDANSDFFKVGRLLWERNRYGWVECSYISLAEPGVPAGIERCCRLGATRVLVVPYFLNTGVLVQRIEAQAIATRARFPEVDIQVASHMGIDERLIDLVLQRTGEVSRPRTEHNLAGKTWRYAHIRGHSHQHGHGHHHAHAHSHDHDAHSNDHDHLADHDHVDHEHRHDHTHGHSHDQPQVRFRHDHRFRIVPSAIGAASERAGAGQPLQATDSQSERQNVSAKAPATAAATGQRATLVERYVLPPAEIESLSLRRVAAALSEGDPWSDAERQVVARIVYAAGDPHLAHHVRLHPNAVQAGIEALRARRPVIADVRMVEVALDRTRLAALGCSVHCAVDEPGVIGAARASGLPRALEAIRSLASVLNDTIVVIGNAPTALLGLLDLVDAGAVRPALIIGTPVGFVAAAESKQELAARTVPFITVDGTRGGSAIAAAALNALLRLATEPAAGESAGANGRHADHEPAEAFEKAAPHPARPGGQVG